jgi:argininosuccinate synthase
VGQVGERVVLAYSGGLNSSVAIPWLRDRCGAEVVTLTMDFGDGREVEEIRERALGAGALRAHVLDVREEFARDFVLPALRADAIDEDWFTMASALGRPLIARRLVEIAEIERTSAVAHGCSGEADDGADLDAVIRALTPTLTVIAAARACGMTRSEKLEYARAHQLALAAADAARDGTRSNLWGRSVRCGTLEDPWSEPPEGAYALTKSPAECPDRPAYVEIEFERGVPTAINGVQMPLLDLVASLGTIAGAHGVGRVDTLEERPTGVRSREVYEAPAAVVLHTAHKELRKFVTARGLDRFSRVVGLEYAEVICSGLWFTPLREALDLFVEKVQERVTGAVRLRLFKGGVRVVGRRSPFASHQHLHPDSDRTRSGTGSSLRTLQSAWPQDARQTSRPRSTIQGS